MNPPASPDRGIELPGEAFGADVTTAEMAGNRPSRRRVTYILIGLGAACLPALIGNGVVARASSLYALSAAPNPYFLLDNALLLRVWAPIVITSSFLLFIMPGALLTLAFGRARSLMEWVVLAFGASLGTSIVLYTLAKLILGLPLSSPRAMGLWVSSIGIAAAILFLRPGNASVNGPFPVARWEWRRVAWMASASLLATALLTPKIFWENFNLDGIEAFEFGRSLAHQVLPSWVILGDAFGFYHNFVLFAYPNHWFIALFGPFEAAARVPFVFYVTLLFPALVLLVEQGRKLRLSQVDEAVIWLMLALYTLVQAFNTNYEPFFADLAENSATDTLAILCFLLAFYALWQERWVWFVAFAAMTYTATPGGLLLLGALTAATVASRWPNWRRGLPAMVAAITVCLLISVIYEFIYAPTVLAEVESQFSAVNMVRRLFPPTLTEFVRFNALVFASGILPAFALLFVRRRSDVLSWTAAAITFIYFGVLYVQVWTSLHQFTPIMVLPLVVFWRLYLTLAPQQRKFILPAVTATVLVSIGLSRPQHFQINLDTRHFGQATEYDIGDYASDYQSAARAGWSLYTLLPEDYRLEYPDQPWGTDAFSWIYYAMRPKPESVDVNYLVQPSHKPVAPGWTLQADQDGISVYIRNIARWREDLSTDFPRVVISPLYEPMLRRTYAFYRAYSEQIEESGQRNEAERGDAGS